MTNQQEAVTIKQEPDCETSWGSYTQFPFLAEYLKQEWSCKSEDSDIYTGPLNASVHMADILDTKLCEDVAQPGSSIKHEGGSPHDKILGVMEQVHKTHETSVPALTDNSYRESRSAADSVVCHHSKTDMSGTENNDVMTINNEIEAGEDVSHNENLTVMSDTDALNDTLKLQRDGTCSTKGDDCDVILAHLLIHQQTSVQEQSDMSVVPGAAFTQGGSKRKQEIIHTSLQPYKCHLCCVSLKCPTELKIHESTHRGEKPYKCDVCGAEFSRGSSLIQHKRAHTGEKPYKCDVCGAEFSEGSNLKKHKRTHTGEKPYKCDICGSEFSHGCSLKKHKRTHTGEKPYTCDVCGAEFNRGSSFSRHKIIHTGEKPYKCDICGADFSSNSKVVEHKTIHTGEKPYKCDICDASFSSNSNVVVHKRIHTGEKPYKCDVCGAEFSHGSSFKRHKRIHTGEKPYKCNICTAEFSDGGYFIKHKRTHT